MSPPCSWPNGWKRLVQGTDLFFLDDLLAKTLAANPETFFNAQSQSAGLKQSLLRTLHALRLGGLRAEHLRSAPRLRTRQLAPLYEAYCKKLAEARLFDLACLFERAIEALRREHDKSGSRFSGARTLCHPRRNPAFNPWASFCGGRMPGHYRPDRQDGLPNRSAERGFRCAFFGKSSAEIRDM